MRPRLHAAPLASLAALALLMTACDIDDGRQMQEPTSTPAPPPTTAAAVDSSDAPTAPASGAVTAPASGADATLTDATLTDATLTGAGMLTLPGESVGASPAGLSVVAPWADGAALPAVFTCDGAGTPPVFNLRAGADIDQLALTIVDDKGVVSLVVAGVPATTQRLDPAALPPTATIEVNSHGQRAYTAPCPDPGVTHTYTTTLYALSRPLVLAETDSVVEIFAELGVASVGTAMVTGTYTRPAA